MALFTKAFGKRQPLKVHFPSARGKYIRFRMKDPKAFAKGSFRTIRAGRRGTKLVIGCPKGQYAKMDGWRCKVGTRTQAVLVPKWRAKAERLRAVANPRRRAGLYPYSSLPVYYNKAIRYVMHTYGINRLDALIDHREDINRMSEIFKQKYLTKQKKNPLLMLAQNRKARPKVHWTERICKAVTPKPVSPVSKWAGTQKFLRHQKTYHRNPFWWKKKGFSKNPLLMVAGNPSDNPRPCPFKKGQKIPIAKFESWLYKNGNPDEIKRYGKSKIGYKKFHLGANPTFITRELIDVGNPKTITDRDFSYTAGKSPHEVYQTPKGSGKQRISRVGFIHKWKNRPETIVSGNKTIIKQLKGQAKITDWMRG